MLSSVQAGASLGSMVEMVEMYLLNKYSRHQVDWQLEKAEIRLQLSLSLGVGFEILPTGRMLIEQP